MFKKAGDAFLKARKEARKAVDNTEKEAISMTDPAREAAGKAYEKADEQLEKLDKKLGDSFAFAGKWA